MLILLYKNMVFYQVFHLYDKFVHSLWHLLDLRGNYILTLPVPRTTTYGLHSFSYRAAKQWNITARHQ